MVTDSVAAGIQVSSASRTELERRLAGLLAANRPALARLAASYTRSASDRDDLLQDIAMALWQALPRFRGDCSERTFLFRIAHNRCLAHLSRRSSLVALDDAQVEVADPTPSAEHLLSQEQQGERLFGAVRQLPLIYRQVITLTLEGLSYREIAQVLGIGESNVGVRLNRARQLLRTILEGDR
jgi:RNA polymerase sigma-70 factor (ECF subfamily)